MKRLYITLTLIALLILAGTGSALAAKPNPPVMPNTGTRYASLSAQWWQWAFSFGANVPYFNTGGAVHISAGQSGRVWFLAGANFGLTEPRTGTVPSGTPLFFPLVNFVNDYPCPPEANFEPKPGETLEQFLQRTGNEALDQFVPDPAKSLFAEIDGAPVDHLVIYRATSAMFTFTADPALREWDACVTGSPQPGVAVGYWLLLPPLSVGTHTLHFGAIDKTTGLKQDITYNLTVTPGHDGSTHAALKRD